MSRNILKNSSILIILTFTSRIFGLVREMVRAAYMGTTLLSDAFSIAFLIPNLFRRLFAEGSMIVALVPTLKGYLIEGDRQKIKDFLSSTFTLLSFAVSSTVIIGILFSPQIVRFMDAKHEETTVLTQIMFPYLAFISIAAFFQGTLNSVDRFGPSGFVPILFNICIIGATIFLSPFTENPARAMAIGVIIGGFLQAIFQLPFVLMVGYRFTITGLRSTFSNKGTRKVLFLIAPTIIGMAAHQINIFISTIIASTAGAGIVSSLQFSLRLQELILGVFAVSIGTVILSQLSENAKKNNWEIFNRDISFSMNIMAIITIPVVFFTLINTESIVALLFKFKEFNRNSVEITAYAFTFHIIGLYFIALTRVVAPSFYAQQDTKSPTIAGIITVIVNILLAFILVGPMKGGGIALASSIAAFINILVLFIMLSKKEKISSKTAIIQPILYGSKITVISLISVIPVYFLQKKIYSIFMPVDNKIISIGLPLFLSSLTFLLIFVALIILIKDKQFFSLINMFRGKLKKI